MFVLAHSHMHTATSLVDTSTVLTTVHWHLHVRLTQLAPRAHGASALPRAGTAT